MPREETKHNCDLIKVSVNRGFFSCLTRLVTNVQNSKCLAARNTSIHAHPVLIAIQIIAVLYRFPV